MFNVRTKALRVLPHCDSCGESYNPELSGNGRFVFYYSAEFGAEPHIRNVFSLHVHPPQVHQRPPVTAGLALYYATQVYQPAVNRSGSRALFLANTNLAGGNPTLGFHVAALNRSKRHVRFVSPGAGAAPALSYSGRYGAYVNATGQARLVSFRLK